MTRVNVRGASIDVDTFPMPFDGEQSLVSLSVNGSEVCLDTADTRVLAGALLAEAASIDGRAPSMIRQQSEPPC